MSYPLAGNHKSWAQAYGYETPRSRAKLDDYRHLSGIGEEWAQVWVAHSKALPYRRNTRHMADIPSVEPVYRSAYLGKSGAGVGEGVRARPPFPQTRSHFGLRAPAAHAMESRNVSGYTAPRVAGAWSAGVKSLRPGSGDRRADVRSLWWRRMA